MNNIIRQVAFIVSGIVVLCTAIILLLGKPDSNNTGLLSIPELSSFMRSTQTLFSSVDSFVQEYDKNLQTADTLGAGVIPFGKRPVRIVSSAAPAALATLFVKGIMMQENPLVIFENAQGVSSICAQGDSIAGLVVKSIRPGQVTVAGPRGVYEIPVNQ